MSNDTTSTDTMSSDVTPNETASSHATPPDRLSTDPASPYFNADMLQRDIGVRFNGRDRRDVDEYCVSEGWIRVAAGKSKDRFGRPMLIRLKGTVEAYFRTPAEPEIASES